MIRQLSYTPTPYNMSHKIVRGNTIHQDNAPLYINLVKMKYLYLFIKLHRRAGRHSAENLFTPHRTPYSKTWFLSQSTDII